MTVHVLQKPPALDLARGLERFEEQFSYPLGAERSFRITHGEDYPRFFRAIGEAACFVVEREGVVFGVLGAALRRLNVPSGEARLVLYVGDLKIDPSARGGKTLLQLVEALQQWMGGRATAAFAVVMDGTSATPPRYTGRLGIPPFSEVGKIVVLRLPTGGTVFDCDADWLTTEKQVEACNNRLSIGWFACPGGNPAERSEMEPLWLMEPDRHACGRLEDTTRAKRLVADDGTEMRSAHLSCFAYEDCAAGVRLVNAAMRYAANHGFPALFVAIPEKDATIFCQLLTETEVVVAPATVFGTGLERWPNWKINTAEI